MSGRECDEALTHLYLYLDRELETTSVDEIRAHLEACSGCLQAFDFETRLRIVVRQRLSEEVPTEVLVRLRQAISQETSAAG